MMTAAAVVSADLRVRAAGRRPEFFDAQRGLHVYVRGQQRWPKYAYALTAARESTLSDRSRADIQIERRRVPAFQEFPGHRGHRGVVGAQFRRGDHDFDRLVCGEFRQPIAQPAVGSDSSADQQHLTSGASDGLSAFLDEHVDNRLLIRGGQVGDARGLQCDRLKSAMRRPLDFVQEGRLESAEAEIELSTVDQRPRKTHSPGIPRRAAR